MTHDRARRPAACAAWLGAAALFAGLVLAGCPPQAGKKAEGEGAKAPAAASAKSAPDPGGDKAMAKKAEPGGKGENPFPGYRPKETPDTVSDYRPGIGKALEGLPEAKLENLPALLARLAEQKALAKDHPGEWVRGDVMLGGDEKEYRPSDEELVEGEIGDRVRKAVAGADAAALKEALAKAGIADEEAAYRGFTFRHVDAMGSGRFFYASAPEEVRVRLAR